MIRVRCQAQATVDAKGRLALPAPLRRGLAEKEITSLVLSHSKGAIWGWTPEDFEVQVERPLEGCDPFSAEVRDFVDAVLAPAQDVEIDSHGRIRIPPMLRRLARIEREVVVNSVLRRVEIWSREAWDRRFEEALGRMANADGMPRAAT